MDEGFAAQVQAAGRCERHLEFVEVAVDGVLVFAKALLQLFNFRTSSRLEMFCQVLCAGGGFVVGEEFVVSVEVADFAGGATDSAKGLAELL